MNIKYTAPVGVILCGETGMPYGKPAWGCALNAWVTAGIAKPKKGSTSLLSETIMKEIGAHTKKILSPIPAVAVLYPAHIPADFEGVAAAEIVAVTSLLYQHFLGKPAAHEAISNMAFRVHKKMYPHASGLYTSLSTFGGLIYFRKEFEFLKGIYKLPYKIPPDIAKRMSIAFQGPKDQRYTAQKIGTLFKEHPQKAEALLAEHEKTTKRALVALIKEDEEMFFAQVPAYVKDGYPFSQSPMGLHAL